MAFIEIHHLNHQLKTMGCPDRQLFCDLNLLLDQEAITVLTGPTGSGKTILSKLIMGMMKPTKGSIFIAGKSVDTYDLAQMGRTIGYLFQNPSLQLFCDRVEEEMLFAFTVMGIMDATVQERCKGLLRDLSLSHLKMSPVDQLSQGEKQRLALGTVLMHQPKYLILDEPTSALDSNRKNDLMEVLKKRNEEGLGMLIITHDLEFMKGTYHKRLTMDKGGRVHEEVL